YGGWQIGNMNAHDYVKKARAFAMVMKRTDPTIQLVGCGQNGWSEWDEIVLGGLAELVDFHSIHLYTGTRDHYTTVFSSHQAERAIRICTALIERVRKLQGITHPIHIAFDEWNVWYRARSHEDRVGGLEERYDLTDALAIASYLNGFIRHCREVRIANFAQLLDAAATCDEAGRRLTLAIVNRERDRDLAATVDLGSATAGSTADIWEVNGPHVAATNSFEAPHAVDVRASRLDLRGSRFDYTFPAHSITLLHLPITR